MAARHARIVHLAVADGRGHLMRAHLLRRLLAKRGIAVDVVTTSEAGRASSPAWGRARRCCPAASRSRSTAGITCSPPRTDRQLAAYIASPSRLGRDVAMLRRLAGARCLSSTIRCIPRRCWLAAAGGRWGARVVHLHGDGLWRAAVSHFDGRLPGWASARYRGLLEALSRPRLRLRSSTRSPAPIAPA